MRYSRASSLFFDVPLALLPSKRDEIVAFWESKLAGEAIHFEDRAEAFAVERHALELDEDEAADNERTQRSGQVAVIPVHGVISQRISMLAAMSGGTSTEFIGKALREQLRDDDVRAVVLDIDSPGGSTYGVTELANLIMDARGQKPIIAVADSVAASAGYWIGAAADNFYVTPGGLVGSIGVYAVHQDISQHAENEGVKVTLISAGKHKTRGNPYGPLSEEDVGYIQSLVDDSYNQFIRDVARGRGVPEATVRTGYGEGDVVTARKARQLRMVDGIKTLEETITAAARARPRKAAPAGQRAELTNDAGEEPEPINEEQEAEEGRADPMAYRRLHWRTQKDEAALAGVLREG